MKKLVLLGCSICTFSITSLASAETLYMPGNSGIVNSALGIVCSEPILTEAKLSVLGSTCEINYPINLPVGKTIDNVSVAYELALPAAPNPSIVAYLVENRVDTGMGVVGVGGTNFKQVTTLGPGVIGMSPLSVPIAAGNVNWVYIDSAYVNVRYVSITYH